MFCFMYLRYKFMNENIIVIELRVVSFLFRAHLLFELSRPATPHPLLI